MKECYSLVLLRGGHCWVEFTSGTGHLRSHILIVALRPDLHKLPEEAYPRLSPRFNTKQCPPSATRLRDQDHLFTYLSVRALYPEKLFTWVKTRQIKRDSKSKCRKWQQDWKNLMDHVLKTSNIFQLCRLKPSFWIHLPKSMFSSGTKHVHLNYWLEENLCSFIFFIKSRNYKACVFKRSTLLFADCDVTWALPECEVRNLVSLDMKMWHKTCNSTLTLTPVTCDFTWTSDSWLGKTWYCPRD